MKGLICILGTKILCGLSMILFQLDKPWVGLWLLLLAVFYLIRAISFYKNNE